MMPDYVVRRLPVQWFDEEPQLDAQFIGPFKSIGEAEQWIQDVGQKQDNGTYRYEAFDLRPPNDDFSEDGDSAYTTVKSI